MSNRPSVVIPTGQVGRYEIVGALGSGSFASVYEAYDPRLDVHVAAKVLADIHSGNPETRERFIQEARLMRRIGTPCLVSVFDIDQTEAGQPFFVMEYLPHGTIADRLSNQGPASADELRRLINGLADALKEVHSRDVVHRDIKPSNILIRATADDQQRMNQDLVADDETLVLADFGLAKDLTHLTSRMTITGGTWAYMAPEQFDPSAKVDARTDLHAASAVVFEAATGYTRNDAEHVTQSNFSELLSELWVGMAESQEDRHSTAEHWRSSLLETLPAPDEAVPSKPKKVRTLSSRQTPYKIAIAALASALLTVVGVLLFLLLSTDATTPSAIVGPRDIFIDQPAVYSADVSPNATYKWIDPQGQEVANEYLLLTATSPGALTFKLIETRPDGSEIEHEITVDVDDR